LYGLPSGICVTGCIRIKYSLKYKQVTGKRIKGSPPWRGKGWVKIPLSPSKGELN
jgi:hypothetical protein